MTDDASYTFRDLDIIDYDTIMGLWKVSGLPVRPTGRDSRTEMARVMLENPGTHIGILFNGVLVGISVISYEGRKGWINRLAVHPDHRRKKLALRLISESERRIKEKGAPMYCALIEGYNEGSMALFEEAGYERMDRIHYYRKRESDDY